MKFPNQRVKEPLLKNANPFLKYYLLISSIEIIFGQWKDDNAKPCTMLPVYDWKYLRLQELNKGLLKQGLKGTGIPGSF